VHLDLNRRPLQRVPHYHGLHLHLDLPNQLCAAAILVSPCSCLVATLTVSCPSSGPSARSYSVASTLQICRGRPLPHYVLLAMYFRFWNRLLVSKVRRNVHMIGV
jgi:hypothetical protein